MYNADLNAYIAVVSHKRPQNVPKIQALIGEATFFVDAGEEGDYFKAGAKNIVGVAGENICNVRNAAIERASQQRVPCIQVSDDLRSLKRVTLKDEQYRVVPVDFEYVVNMLLNELHTHGFNYGGVAVTTNRLNYTGTDTSYDKLVVNDLIAIMPDTCLFDPVVALKEDYDLTISELLGVGGVVRCNNFLCDFPHRDNEGGANAYRDARVEQAATDALYAKWGELIKKHPTRDGQVSLNYKAIAERKGGTQVLF